jgi:hypothetical protein
MLMIFTTHVQHQLDEHIIVKEIKFQQFQNAVDT